MLCRQVFWLLLGAFPKALEAFSGFFACFQPKGWKELQQRGLLRNHTGFPFHPSAGWEPEQDKDTGGFGK
jgi:hypothetical protein